jgi:hypothetical protein
MFPQLMSRYGGRILAGAALGGNTLHNFYQQNQVLTGQQEAPEGSRLQAVSATQNFPQGTVGYGAHLPIRALHGFFGGLGQAQIGSLFSGPQAQQLMNQPMESPANEQLAQLEYNYWDNVHQNPTSVNDSIGGFAGTSFGPGTRANIQSAGAWLRPYMDMLNGRRDS